MPLTQGSSGPGTGTTRGLTTAKLLGSNGLVYAGDPAFGVKANGSTDDTSAWTAALAYAASTGAAVLAPIGVSNVTSITIPQNVAIIGRNVECTSVASAQGSISLGSVIFGTSNSLPAIVMSPNSQIRSIQVDGNSGQDCIRLSGSTFGSYHIYDADIFGGLNAINGNSTAASLLMSNCRIHECTNGIVNLIDGNIVGNIITSCTTTGMALGANCARVTITGNRITANGINLSFNGVASTTPVANVVVSGNLIQDATGNNVYLNYCHNVVIGSNEIGCGGRGQSGSPGTANDANFQISNCTGVLINGNSTWVGNDITSYVGPYWSCWDGGGNVNCQISCNILPYHNNASSSTSGPINVTTTFNLASSLNITYWTAGN